MSVHQLVALTYLPNPDAKPIVNHKDGIRDHNEVENLEWATHTQNMRHAASVPGRRGLCGGKHPNAKLNEEQVKQILVSHAAGEPCRVLAERYGVSKTLVVHITKRIQWRHVTV